MSANDIRELENLDRIPAEEGGDLYLINGNISTLICLDKDERSHVECVVLMLRKKYIKPTRVFELEDGVGIYRNRRR